jgi:hypothetical protein
MPGDDGAGILAERWSAKGRQLKNNRIAAGRSRVGTSSGQAVSATSSTISRRDG